MLTNYEHFTEIQTVIHTKINNREKAGCYQFWLRSFLDFHKMGVYGEFGSFEAQMFLQYLVEERGAGLDQLESARKALNFYYHHVQKKDLVELKTSEVAQAIVKEFRRNQGFNIPGYQEHPSISMFRSKPVL